MPDESTLNLLSTISLFFAQQASARAEKLLAELVQREPPAAGPSRVAGAAAASAVASAAAAAPVPGMGTAGRAAGAAAATFATGWAVANDKVPPATGIIPYAILETAAEFKVKTEQRVFEGSNVALGVLLFPFHLLSCGLRALGWARIMVCSAHTQCTARLARLLPLLTNVTRMAVCAEQPEGATPLRSIGDSADAQRLRFVQRELAELKAEISLIRQAAQGVPGVGAALALAAAPEQPAVAARSAPALRAAPPPPPPPPPPQPAGSAPAVHSTPTSDKVPPVSNTPADMDGKTDLMAAIRAAGGESTALSPLPLIF